MAVILNLDPPQVQVLSNQLVAVQKYKLAKALQQVMLVVAQMFSNSAQQTILNIKHQPAQMAVLQLLQIQTQ